MHFYHSVSIFGRRTEPKQPTKMTPPTRSRGSSWRALAACSAAALLLISPSSAVLSTGQISLQLHRSATPNFADLLASPSASAGWGVRLPQLQNSRWKHVHMQALDANNAEGCLPYTLSSFLLPHDLHIDPYKTLVLVDRGNCSFVHKTQVAMAAGARGVVIRGTKKAVYDSVMSQNKTNATGTDPFAIHDDPRTPVFEYSCANGEAFVPTTGEPAWATDDPACSSNPTCDSKMCVLTGKHDATRGGHQLCCLWDTHILMGAGNRTLAKNVSIPVVYVTIAEGKQLERTWTKYPQVLMRTYERAEPLIDLASILLWMLGVCTAVGGAYYAATSDREKYRCRTDPEYLARRQQQQQQQSEDQGPRQDDEENEAWEIDGKTAVAFIGFAALFLTVLYYVKITRFIPILFAFSATGTFTQLITAPLLQACVPAIASRQFSVPVINDTWPLADILGMFLSGALAVVWFVHRRSAWYLQDVFGVTLCFVFLRTVQLPNLKVATILLSLAFFYDIFFVFISPLIFGSSVMEDVATGGPAAYTRSDYPGIDFCERYPQYSKCLDPEPMPMLLVLPRIMNWVGGVSMLGLGDIILPGLLLTYALRFDYSPQSLGENYFHSVCIGYAVGLAMANAAVTVMQMGQPALMYLVPTCLGTILVRAKWTGDLKAMWLGLGMKEQGYDKRYESEQPQTTQPKDSQAIAVNDDAPLLGPGLASPR